jgi:hypothetical protein
MVGLGVLADVERCQLQTESRQGAQRPGDLAGRDELAAVSGQRSIDEPKVVQQRAGTEVVASGLVQGAGGEPGPGVCQLSAMQRSFSR